MNRDDLNRLMLLHAAGIANPEETANAEAALASGDPSAQSAFQEAQAVFNIVMPQSVQRVQLPPRLRERLMERLGDSAVLPAARPARQPAADHPLILQPNWAFRFVSGLAAVLLIGLLASVVGLVRVSSANTALAERTIHLQEQLAEVDSVMSSRYVSLAKFENPSTRAYGRALFCPVDNTYRVSVFNLEQPPAGRVYKLWLITADQRKIPAGLLTVDGAGKGCVVADVPKGTRIAATAITDEPVDGASDTPTGQICLTGQVAVDGLHAD